MKLTDYLAHFLRSKGILHAFGVTGGAVVHFFDSLERLKFTTSVFTHHEQSASFAAEAYARMTNDVGVCFVTTGPGCTNALTGLCAAWLDSIPCLFISGQQRLAYTNHQRPFRQLGSQQIDIVTLVRPISKHATMLTDSSQIKYELQKAFHIAKSGRPGPVWLDIPLDLQLSSIDVDNLAEFRPADLEPSRLEDKIEMVLQAISEARRPLILIGQGVRLAGAEALARTLMEKSGIPVISSWNAMDMFLSACPQYLGRIGIAGQRGANLAVQNCDLLLTIGSHLSMCLTGSNFGAFARAAKKIVVNIDPVQIEYPTVKIDLPILADAKQFLEVLNSRIDKKEDLSAWLGLCERYRSYNLVPEVWRAQQNCVNPYVFIDQLSGELDSSDTVVVDGGGTVTYSSFQALKVKSGQRVIASTAIGSMGSGLPESIGACFANRKQRVICLVGDGSMQFNIQELQTIVHHQLPIKIVIFNNGGYLSIRHTQQEFLDSSFLGSSERGGLSLPDYQKVVVAYGISVSRIDSHIDLRDRIRLFLDAPGPAVCEIIISENQELVPRMGFKRNAEGMATGVPLEDMAPFLERSELEQLMVIPPIE